MLADGDEIIAVGPVAVKKYDELFSLATAGGQKTWTVDLLHRRYPSVPSGKANFATKFHPLQIIVRVIVGLGVGRPLLQVQQSQYFATFSEAIID
jgi:hypothetical protein